MLQKLRTVIYHLAVVADPFGNHIGFIEGAQPLKDGIYSGKKQGF